jgi:hypothetical protein
VNKQCIAYLYRYVTDCFKSYEYLPDVYKYLWDISVYLPAFCWTAYKNKKNRWTYVCISIPHADGSCIVDSDFSS